MTNRLRELNSLEEAEAEKVAGQPYTDLEEDDRPKVKLIAALAWVHRRRTEPDLKFHDFMASGRFADHARYLLADQDEDEATEAGEDDPFPESPSSEAGADREGAADAEGAVLPGDGRVSE